MRSASIKSHTHKYHFKKQQQAHHNLHKQQQAHKQQQGHHNLHKNKLTAPQEIYHASHNTNSIQHKSKHYGKLKQIPELMNPERILKLNYSLNDIKTIPSFMKLALHLECLDLSNNKIQNIDNLYGLASLKMLNLSHNIISQISQQIVNMRCLQNLDLSFNKICLLNNVKYIKEFVCIRTTHADGFIEINFEGNDLIKKEKNRDTIHLWMNPNIPKHTHPHQSTHNHFNQNQNQNNSSLFLMEEYSKSFQFNQNKPNKQNDPPILNETNKTINFKKIYEEAVASEHVPDTHPLTLENVQNTQYKASLKNIIPIKQPENIQAKKSTQPLKQSSFQNNTNKSSFQNNINKMQENEIFESFPPLKTFKNAIENVFFFGQTCKKLYQMQRNLYLIEHNQQFQNENLLPLTIKSAITLNTSIVRDIIHSYEGIFKNIFQFQHSQGRSTEISCQEMSENNGNGVEKVQEKHTYDVIFNQFEEDKSRLQNIEEQHKQIKRNHLKVIKQFEQNSSSSLVLYKPWISQYRKLKQLSKAIPFHLQSYACCLRRNQQISQLIEISPEKVNNVDLIGQQNQEGQSLQEEGLQQEQSSGLSSGKKQLNQLLFSASKSQSNIKSYSNAQQLLISNQKLHPANIPSQKGKSILNTQNKSLKQTGDNHKKEYRGDNHKKEYRGDNHKKKYRGDNKKTRNKDVLECQQCFFNKEQIKHYQVEISDKAQIISKLQNQNQKYLDKIKMLQQYKESIDQIQHKQHVIINQLENKIVPCTFQNIMLEQAKSIEIILKSKKYEENYMSRALVKQMKQHEMFDVIEHHNIYQSNNSNKKRLQREARPQKSNESLKKKELKRISENQKENLEKQLNEKQKTTKSNRENKMQEQIQKEGIKNSQLNIKSKSDRIIGKNCKIQTNKNHNKSIQSHKNSIKRSNDDKKGKHPNQVIACNESIFRNKCLEQNKSSHRTDSHSMSYFKNKSTTAHGQTTKSHQTKDQNSNSIVTPFATIHQNNSSSHLHHANKDQVLTKNHQGLRNASHEGEEYLNTLQTQQFHDVIVSQFNSYQNSQEKYIESNKQQNFPEDYNIQTDTNIQKVSNIEQIISPASNHELSMDKRKSQNQIKSKQQSLELNKMNGQLRSANSEVHNKNSQRQLKRKDSNENGSMNNKDSNENGSMNNKSSVQRKSVLKKESFERVETSKSKIGKQIKSKSIRSSLDQNTKQHTFSDHLDANQKQFIQYLQIEKVINHVTSLQSKDGAVYQHQQQSSPASNRFNRKDSENQIQDRTEQGQSEEGGCKFINEKVQSNLARYHSLQIKDRSIVHEEKAKNQQEYYYKQHPYIPIKVKQAKSYKDYIQYHLRNNILEILSKKQSQNKVKQHSRQINHKQHSGQINHKQHSGQINYKQHLLNDKQDENLALKNKKSNYILTSQSQPKLNQNNEYQCSFGGNMQKGSAQMGHDKFLSVKFLERNHSEERIWKKQADLVVNSNQKEESLLYSIQK